MKGLKNVLVGLTLTVLGHSAAQAATIQVQLQGLNFTYDEAAGTLCDAGGCADGPSFDPGFNMLFLSDGNPLGTIPNGVGSNIGLQLAPGTSPVGLGQYQVANNVGIFDFLIAGNPGLYTDVVSGVVTFGALGINATGFGFSSIFSQALPYGLIATNPINWSFSTGVGQCTGTAGTQICTYAGTGELSWEQVPEPGSLALLGLGLIGLGVARRRKA